MGIAARRNIDVDRRQHGRTAVYRPAKLLAGGYACAGMIRDISPEGARLTCRSFHGRELVLVDLEVGMAHEALVMWRKDDDLGVRFTRSQDLRGLVAANFQAAKQIWRAGLR